MSTAQHVVEATQRQEMYRSWASDVLVFTLVLNLFDEYVDAIVIQSFTISVLTAALMKVLLDVLGRVEHRVHEALGALNKVLGTIAVLVVLFLSKFVILATVDFIFGDEVELGHFFDVVVLIMTLLGARQLNERVYEVLGDSDQETDAP